MRVGINGLGRIGRALIRSIFESGQNELEIAAINGSVDGALHAHLLQYDSVHGKFSRSVEGFPGSLSIGGEAIPFYRERNPENIPWSAHNVDLVFECTGAFNSKEGASKHDAGRVIVSAPVQDADITVVYGVNHRKIESWHKVISAASCTTNCVVPLIDVLHKNFGIRNGFMTTVHSYTNDQSIVDSNHKDLRRARAGALSMIPTATGAAKSVGLIIPELNGKIDGAAIRVPTPNVSVVDLCCTLNKKAQVSEINDLFVSNVSDVFSVCDKPLVSIDFNHSSHSCTVDLLSTYVVDSEFCRVLAWYDNEWAFCLRMLDIAKFLKNR